MNCLLQTQPKVFYCKVCPYELNAAFYTTASTLINNNNNNNKKAPSALMPLQP